MSTPKKSKPPTGGKGKSRRMFTPEEKRAAVARSLELQSVQKAAAEIGVRPNLVTRWRGEGWGTEADPGPPPEFKLDAPEPAPSMSRAVADAILEKASSKSKGARYAEQELEHLAQWAAKHVEERGAHGLNVALKQRWGVGTHIAKKVREMIGVTSAAAPANVAEELRKAADLTEVIERMEAQLAELHATRNRIFARLRIGS